MYTFHLFAGAGGGIPVVVVSVGGINITVLGLHVDLDLWMIGSQVALTASLGLTRLHNRELVAG